MKNIIMVIVLLAGLVLVPVFVFADAKAGSTSCCKLNNAACCSETAACCK